MLLSHLAWFTLATFVPVCGYVDFQSLKVVASKCALKLSLPETAPLETDVLTCTDTDRSYRVFRLVLFQHGPFSGRA